MVVNLSRDSLKPKFDLRRFVTENHFYTCVIVIIPRHTPTLYTKVFFLWDLIVVCSLGLHRKLDDLFLTRTNLYYTIDYK